MNEYRTRIKMKRDTNENWTSEDPVLLDGEVVLVKMSDGTSRFKVGDGVQTFTKLRFVDDVIVEELDGKAESSIRISTTLKHGGWAESKQSVSVPNLGAQQNGYVGLADTATVDEVNAAVKAGLYVDGQSEGSLSIGARNGVPTIDIPITLTLIG